MKRRTHEKLMDRFDITKMVVSDSLYIMIDFVKKHTIKSHTKHLIVNNEPKKKNPFVS